MKSLVALLLCLTSASAMAGDQAIARQYLSARSRTLKRGATAADVANVVSLFAEDVVVEFPLHNGLVRGRKAVARGMESHLADYTGSSSDSGILSSLDSPPGVAVFRVRISFVVGEGAARQVISGDHVIIVEIRNSLVCRVIEY